MPQTSVADSTLECFISTALHPDRMRLSQVDGAQEANKPGVVQVALEAVENAVESVAGSLEQAVDKVLPG